MTCEPIYLTPNQGEYIRSLIRRDLRKTIKSRSRLHEKFGQDADLALADQKIDFIKVLYSTLGGKPENISNLRDGS